MASFSRVKYIKHKENPTSFKKGDPRLIGNKINCGRVPWNKNKSIRLNPKGEFKKGMTPWNKGLKGFMAGENHYNWKGGITSESYKQRRLFKKQLQHLIFKRDGYKCQICESKEDLQVDHIQSWSEFKELRFDPENCRTLCAKCHYKITFNREMPETIRKWGHNLGRT